MKENNYYTAPITENQSREVCNKKDTFWHRKKFNILSLIACTLFVIVSVCFIRSMLAIGTKSAKEKYDDVKAEVSEKVYNDFYQKSYDISESKHHVSNEISITIGSLKEQAKLEVLKISEVEYVTPEDEDSSLLQSVIDTLSDLFVGDVVSWLEVPGYGVFTVDLQSSEFIIDDERQNVLIRIPAPELSEFTIDYANVELLNFEETGLFKNSAKVGEDVARKQLQSAELKMRQSANSNQRFYLSARDGATNMLVNLVKQLNPQSDKLVVEVEFIE